MKSKKKLFTSKLIDLLAVNGMTKLANKTSFEPIITGIKVKGY